MLPRLAWVSLVDSPASDTVVVVRDPMFKIMIELAKPGMCLSRDPFQRKCNDD